MAKSVRIVVDPNVLISALMGGRLSGFADLLVDPEIEWFTGKDQIAELIDVVERGKFRKFFTLKEARAAVGISASWHRS